MRARQWLLGAGLGLTILLGVAMPAAAADAAQSAASCLQTGSGTSAGVADPSNATAAATGQATPAVASGTDATLPFTGLDSTAYVLVGVGLMATGGAVVFLSRRRQHAGRHKSWLGPVAGAVVLGVMAVSQVGTAWADTPARAAPAAGTTSRAALAVAAAGDCSDPAVPPAVTPESPMALLLPVSAIALLGVWALRRRRGAERADIAAP